MASPDISIVIPTQRRPEGLARAARSALAQAGVDYGRIELVIADNDAAPSARAATEALRAQAPCPVHYVHEPRAGVANVRNAGLTASSGDLIAFLDDDEEAAAGWLSAHLAALSQFEADGVFGPVRGRAPASAGRHRAYLERFFSRVGPEQAGVLDGYYGCGNSLLRRAALPDPLRPFADARNWTGGEDDLLFAGMKAAGARFAWSPDAWVWEDPSAERLNLRYALRRAFAYGQGPTVAAAVASPPRWLGVVGWMAAGLLQALGFGALGLLLWTLHAPGGAATLDRAARGLGKLLWFGPFKIQFYGLPAPTAQWSQS